MLNFLAKRRLQPAKVQMKSLRCSCLAAICFLRLPFTVKRLPQPGRGQVNIRRRGCGGSCKAGNLTGSRVRRVRGGGRSACGGGNHIVVVMFSRVLSGLSVES